MTTTLKQQPHILDFKGFDPRRNLPWISSGKRGESNFLGGFERAFMLKQKNGIGGRHFPLSGFGIADFIWIAPRFDKENFREKKTKINSFKNIENWNVSAFELKLSDWKQALLQAYRYSYFADQSIVVMPFEKIETVSKELNSFKDSGVGLWLFDKKSGLIDVVYSPSNIQARSQSARSKALNIIQSKIELSKFYKELNPLLQRV